jgi:hypothetical protein
MKPEIIIVDGTDFTSGTNRFYGIQATVRKFLFFKKKVIALNPFCYNTPKKALAAVMGRLTHEERNKATYQAFIQTVEVYGWCNGKPLAKYGEPSWWKKWDFATLAEKAKNW